MKDLVYNGTTFSDYKIDDKGDVYSKTGRKLKPWDNGRGYLIVDVMKDREVHRVRIHRASAETYLGRPDEKLENMVVGHIDNNKHNNSYKNLKWITQKENVASAQVEIKGMDYLDAKTVERINTMLKTQTIGEVSNELNLKRHIVRDIKIGKTYK